MSNAPAQTRAEEGHETGQIAGYTVTKIRCTSCKGSGDFLSFMPCMWCGGKKKLSRDKALQHANHVYMLAGGGYIAGDHDLKDCREMEAEAEASYAAFGLVPPWRLSRAGARP